MSTHAFILRLFTSSFYFMLIVTLLVDHTPWKKLAPIYPNMLNCYSAQKIVNCTVCPFCFLPPHSYLTSTAPLVLCSVTLLYLYHQCCATGTVLLIMCNLYCATSTVPLVLCHWYCATVLLVLYHLVLGRFIDTIVNHGFFMPRYDLHVRFKNCKCDMYRHVNFLCLSS